MRRPAPDSEYYAGDGGGGYPTPQPWKGSKGKGGLSAPSVVKKLAPPVVKKLAPSVIKKGSILGVLPKESILGSVLSGATSVTVSTDTGKGDPTVEYLVGAYFPKGTHHNRRQYQKMFLEGEGSVVLYYFDERDGVEVNGWWFAEAVDAPESAMAFCPSRSQKPPVAGWRVPPEAEPHPGFLIVKETSLSKIESGSASNASTSSTKKTVDCSYCGGHSFVTRYSGGVCDVCFVETKGKLRKCEMCQPPVWMCTSCDSADAAPKVEQGTAAQVGKGSASQVGKGCASQVGKGIAHVAPIFGSAKSGSPAFYAPGKKVESLLPPSPSCGSKGKSEAKGTTSHVPGKGASNVRPFTAMADLAAAHAAAALAPAAATRAAGIPSGASNRLAGHATPKLAKHSPLEPYGCLQVPEIIKVDLTAGIIDPESERVSHLSKVQQDMHAVKEKRAQMGATIHVRKAAQKLTSATLETCAHLAKEVSETYVQQLRAMGPMTEQMADVVEKAFLQLCDRLELQLTWIDALQIPEDPAELAKAAKEEAKAAKKEKWAWTESAVANWGENLEDEDAKASRMAILKRKREEENSIRDEHRTALEVRKIIGFAKVATARNYEAVIAELQAARDTSMEGVNLILAEELDSEITTAVDSLLEKFLTVS